MAHEVVLQCEGLTEMLEDVCKEPTKTSISVPRVVEEIWLDLSGEVFLNPSIARSPEQKVVTLKVQPHLVQEPFYACSQVMKVLAEAPVPRPMKKLQVRILPRLECTTRKRIEIHTR